MNYCYALKLRKDKINPLNTKKYDSLFKNNKDFDVVIEFTTGEYCVECDYLERQFGLLKDEFLDDGNLYFARVDIMKIGKNSDITVMQVDGIPAVIFYPRGASPKKGKIYKYNGDRYRKELRFDTMADWVRKNYNGDKQEL